MTIKDEDEDDQLTPTARARMNRSITNPGFRGTLETDITIDVFGLKTTRKLKVEWTRTPDWGYFDLGLQRIYRGWGGSSWQVFVLTDFSDEDHGPDGPDEDSRPKWLALEDVNEPGVLPHCVWDQMIQLIDEQCRLMDAERRMNQPPAGSA